MALPKLNNIEFLTEIPSTKKEIRFRPFTIKEQKALLIARESADKKSILNSVVTIISDCVLDDIDVSKLAGFDIEFLFLQIRGQSIGDVIPLKLRPDCFEECKTPTEVEINLKDIKVIFPDNASDIIELNDTYSVKMRYPDYRTLMTVNTQQLDVDQNIEFLARNIAMVFDKDAVHDTFTLDEAKDFILSLTVEQLDKILEFFRNAPVMKHTLDYKCMKCGKGSKLELNGLQDFFSLG